MAFVVKAATEVASALCDKLIAAKVTPKPEVAPTAAAVTPKPKVPPKPKVQPPVAPHHEVAAAGPAVTRKGAVGEVDVGPLPSFRERASLFGNVITPNGPVRLN